MPSYTIFAYFLIERYDELASFLLLRLEVLFIFQGIDSLDKLIFHIDAPFFRRSNRLILDLLILKFSKRLRFKATNIAKYKLREKRESKNGIRRFERRKRRGVDIEY